MKKRIISIVMISLLLIHMVQGNSIQAISSENLDAPIIIDHNRINLNQIPEEWILKAKEDLHIAYGHTSHGSQLTKGMEGLVSFKSSLYAFNTGGVNGALDFRDQPFNNARDLGSPNYTSWVESTRAYLNANPEINVIMWSWCGQVSHASEQIIDNYLTNMNLLENEFPQVAFVYMTGHVDGTGENGTLHKRNEQIRNYCEENNKILYDFADIESYDPDGHYYLDKNVNDNCDYDSDGDGSLDANWALQWQESHQIDVDWYDCYAAHSYPVNANMKAYAAWWLFARLSGWSESDTGIDTPIDIESDTDEDVESDIDNQLEEENNTSGDTNSDANGQSIGRWIKPIEVIDGCNTKYGENLYDGNEETAWQHFAEEKHWIVLDLGESMKVSKIRLWQRNTFDTVYSLEEIYVSDTADSFIESSGSTPRIYGVEPGWKTYDLTETSGRYVKLVTENCRTPYMREIEFYVEDDEEADSETGSDVESGQQTGEETDTETGTEQDSETESQGETDQDTLVWGKPVNVIDGCDTRYALNLFDNDEQTIWQHFTEEKHWIILDLGKSKDVSKIRLWQRNTYDTVYAFEAIYVSDSIDDFGESIGSTSRIYATEPGWKEFSLQNKKGRYVKLVTETCRSPYCRELEFGYVESQEDTIEEPTEELDTFYANSLSISDIQAAVNQAKINGGGTVLLPEGTIDHEAAIIQLPDGISLIGSGNGKTNIINADIRCIPRFYGDLNKPFRLSGMSLKGNSHILVRGCDGFRIDHIEIECTSGAAMSIIESTASVIDHCKVFVEGSYYGVVVSDGYSSTYENDWKDTKTLLGSDKAIFIEDCVFDGCHHSIVGHGNAHYVVRFCQFINNNSHPVDAHGPGYGPECGTRLVECYNNTFDNPDSTWKAIAIRGGGAVIFNNIAQGYENGVILTLESRAAEFEEGMRPNDIWIWDNQFNASDETVFVTSAMNNHAPLLSENEIIENSNYFLRAPSLDRDGFEYEPYAYPHPLNHN